MHRGSRDSGPLPNELRRRKEAGSCPGNASPADPSEREDREWGRRSFHRRERLAEDGKRIINRPRVDGERGRDADHVAVEAAFADQQPPLLRFLEQAQRCVTPLRLAAPGTLTSCRTSVTTAPTAAAGVWRESALDFSRPDGTTTTVWAEAKQQRVAHDLEYIRRQSFWFDLEIVLRTAFGRGARANAY